MNVYFTIRKDGNKINSFVLKTDVKNIQYASKPVSKIDTSQFTLDKSHLISVGTGYSKHIERDGAISPFIYRGIATPFEISYKYFGTKSRHTFSLYFDNLQLTPSIPDYANAYIYHYMQNLNISMDYSYNRKIYTAPKIKTMFFIGGKFETFLNFRSHATDNLMFDQFNSINLNILAEKRFVNNKHILLFNFSMPIISYALMRGTYNGRAGEKIDPLDLSKNVLPQLFKNGNIITVNRLLKLKTDISYIRFICKHIGFELKYSFGIYSFTQYDNLFYSRNVNNQILFAIIGKF